MWLYCTVQCGGTHLVYIRISPDPSLFAGVGLAYETKYYAGASKSTSLVLLKTCDSSTQSIYSSIWNYKASEQGFWLLSQDPFSVGWVWARDWHADKKWVAKWFIAICLIGRTQHTKAHQVTRPLSVNRRETWCHIIVAIDVLWWHSKGKNCELVLQTRVVLWMKSCWMHSIFNCAEAIWQARPVHC